MEDDGSPVGYEMCLEYLISEYEFPRDLAKATKAAKALLRLMEFIYDDGDKPIGAPMINRTVEVPQAGTPPTASAASAPPCWPGPTRRRPVRGGRYGRTACGATSLPGPKEPPPTSGTDLPELS
jgi:hypothetical protein